MSNTLYRASFELQPVEGRTLIGLAVPWEAPSLVRDMVGPPYLEAFAAASCDVSISQRADRPVFVRHDYAADPIGMSTFQRSTEGLLFEAVASKTKRADEILEMVNDGSMRSVSVGFRPLKSTRRMVAAGELTLRTEVALRELSIAPTGFGAYPEAGVLAVREGEPAGEEVVVDEEAAAELERIARVERDIAARRRAAFLREHPLPFIGS
jgi:HK97 family phage prohead protease